MKDLNSVVISKATFEDAEGIQELTKDASKGMYELCGWSTKEIDNHFSPEKMKEGVDKLRKAITTFTGSDILFVAKDGSGNIIGCCFAEKGKDVNKIEAVFVLPVYQGCGLGKKLYEKACELLNVNNDTVLDVFSLNSKAIGFYKRLGFIETSKKSFDERFTDSAGKRLEITEMILPGKKI